MIELNRRFLIAATAIFAATISTCPAQAQRGPDYLDVLIQASLRPDTGMNLARRQIADTDLLAALGTLERVTIAHPEAVDARLLYISLLCRLDDREGAEVELGLLGGQAIPDDGWAEVSAACGSVARPGRRGSGR
ncbi:MAG TPA: hypothetical protein VGD66_11190 [Allosphingosinicella sp.]